MFDVIQNRRAIFGPGTIGELPGVLQAITKETVLLMVYDEAAQCVRRAKQMLEEAEIAYVVDASVCGEPSIEDVDRCAAFAMASGCGAVVAIGGGSVMDAAKAVAMLCTNGGKTEQYQMEGKPIERPALPIVAVPTTAGTGSEATKVSVVFHPGLRLKKSFYSPWMIAETVILDPEVTLALPREITVSTGVDALSHAIESYVSKKATPYTEMYSLQAMKLIVSSLEACVSNPNDLEARSNMLLGSYLAGCALNAGIGLAHILAQPLGGLIGIPHGVGCAIYLPYAMQHNLSFCTEKYCEIARIFGIQGENSLALAEKGLQRVQELLKRLDAPSSIRGYLPDDFDLDQAADAVQAATGHIKNDYNPVTREVIRRVIAASMT